MTGSRKTATVRLIDGTSVTVPEPVWCIGRHDQGNHLADLEHEGTQTTLTVETERGAVELLHAVVTQAPYSTNPENRRINLAVNVGGDFYRFRDEADLLRLADALSRHAVTIRLLGRHLAVLLAAEGRP